IARDADATTAAGVRAQLGRQLDAATVRAYELAGVETEKNTSRAPISGVATPPGLAGKAYRLATRMLEPVAPRILDKRARRGKEDPTRRNERLGHPGAARPEGRLVWFHAASVGELNAIATLLAHISERPNAPHLLVTTGTVTSAERAKKILPSSAIHQFIPLDGPRMMRRFLAHWRPAAAFLVESELWPNLVFETRRAGVPLILLNARMSERSAKAWRKPFRRRLGAALVTAFDLILAQSPRDMQRLMRLGAHRIEEVGNLKSDAAPATIGPAARSALEETLGGRQIIVAASTHPGEDALIARAFQAAVATIRASEKPLLVIAPRHPERGPQITELLREDNIEVALRSAQQPVTAKTDVYVADTLGELPLFFDSATLAIMGGSFIEHGGQNPLEAIRQGVAVLSGPHVFNFAEIYSALVEAEATRIVSDEGALSEAIADLLGDDATRDTMIAASADALRHLEGATERTLALIDRFLTGAPSSAPRKAGDRDGT
ncbi:MAG: 3-deoxy-D-manno-octulosonic acid transferase, partial [Pseudomonadota bacterium]